MCSLMTAPSTCKMSPVLGKLAVESDGNHSRQRPLGTLIDAFMCPTRRKAWRVDDKCIRLANDHEIYLQLCPTLVEDRWNAHLIRTNGGGTMATSLQIQYSHCV